MAIYMREYSLSAYHRVVCCIAIIFVAVLCFGAPAYAGSGQDISVEPQFFSSLRDIPLMPGMEELEDQGVSFDKPGGRISEAFALLHGVARGDVLHFYDATLPQLGWGKVSEYRFFRQNEILDFSFEENGGQLIVKIMIKPTL
ncbi:MAG: hypothetical protein COA45_06755 [Zetaproteobacteria bacterium]|nr:MAG: hypothetical protein COA45_06755 [Zetaproteobacteria bacterium]